MNEKAKTIVAGASLLLMQGIVAWAVCVSSWCMAANWTEGGQTNRALPRPTMMALYRGEVIPIIGALLTLTALAVAVRRGSGAAHWLIGVAVLEILVLSLFAVAITMPAATSVTCAQ